jgi:D-alanyl-D-alanine carboxypeptidase
VEGGGQRRQRPRALRAVTVISILVAGCGGQPGAAPAPRPAAAGPAVPGPRAAVRVPRVPAPGAFKVVVYPEVVGGAVDPPAAAAWANRSRHSPALISHGDAVWRAFSSVGWKWGGDWISPKDYQHFSANGR